MAIQFDPSQLLPQAAPAATGAQTPGAGGAFSNSLNKMLDAVDKTTGAANDAVSGMLEGTTDVHEAMIALQRAETTFQLSVQMKNKFVSAYTEIMRMPV